MLPTVNAVRDLQVTDVGVSRAHIMACSDGNKYVVKFVRITSPNNKTVINELIGGSIASRIGLPCPETVLVSISPEFIKNSDELTRDGIREGLHIGSKFVGGQNFYKFRPEYLVGKHLTNTDDLYGVITFDNWVLNSDRDNIGNNLIEFLPNSEMYYRMIDFGHCFTGDTWNANQLSQRINDPNIVPCLWFVRDNTTDVSKFEQWFKIVEELGDEEIAGILADTPKDWNLANDERECLLALINTRRKAVRTYILASRGRL